MKTLLGGWLFALICLAPAGEAVAGYSALYVFGDSLSDSGNNAAVVAPNVTPVPIPGNDFIATYPYASGRYTNGDVWAQTLASALGLSAAPSLTGGTDYAFGGAQTGPLTPNPLPGGLLAPFPPSVETQVAYFLSQHSNAAPSSALYIVEGGGEDVLQALRTINGCGGSLGCIDGVITSATQTFAANIGNIVSTLQLAGATNIVLWDVPDVGVSPAAHSLGVSALATGIAWSMNLALSSAIGTDPDVELFNAFGLLDQVVADPSAFGLTNVADACAQFVTCDPSQYLFWDGIHSTSAANPIITDAILALIGIPEPSALSLFGVGLVGLFFAGYFARYRVRRCLATKCPRSGDPA